MDRPSSGRSPDGAAESPAAAHAAAQVFVDDVDTPVLDPDDGHHLSRVLRLRADEVVVVADGRGAWRRCRFAAGTAGRGGRAGAARLEPDGDVVRVDRVDPVVTIAFVATKGSRPEWAVQKLTEVGVDEIVLLQSARAVVQWEGDRSERALDRLRKVARSAAAQSRRPWIPDVTGIETIDALVRRLAPVPLAVAEVGGGPPHLGLPAVAVGPEGGWDAVDPVDGLPAVGLGPGVLRSETAAVAAGLLLAALRAGVVAHAPGRTSG